KEPPEEAPADQARSTLTGRRQGLGKLSPDLLSKASDETAKQVTRIGLTFFGTAAFCLLSLLSPDSALLGGNEKKINLPLAGPVSFSGFMLLGPAVLIVLRIYLQIYVDHGDRLFAAFHAMCAARLKSGAAEIVISSDEAVAFLKAFDPYWANDYRGSDGHPGGISKHKLAALLHKLELSAQGI